jgi:hypothetical protein
MLPQHKILNFVASKQGSTVLAHIKKDVDDDTYRIIAQFLDENFKRNGKNPQWFVKASEANDLCQAVDDIINDIDQDESDDELIRETLARRFKSQSSGKVIEENNVEDSEDEDVVSLSRRIRFLYRVIDKLKGRIEELEK